ncbi:unnamed protein product [Brassicogethes aeneus]|uniref:Uncharacterized protein n=1 Tax=Brassicogethes aeneus TaxID=1431903 RepID=A0A9P0AY83_BRAAE|nr:unnamed protein product [Brassicogethes aeneus]
MRKHFVKDYYVSDPKFPRALCGTCRLVVQQYGKQNFQRKIHLFNYSKLDTHPQNITRNTCSQENKSKRSTTKYTLARGRSHHCSKGKKYLNAISLTGSSQKLQEKLASTILISRIGENPNDSIDLSTTRGPLLSIHLKPDRCVENTAKLSASSFSKIQYSLNLSVNTTLHLREENLLNLNKLQEKYHEVDAFFETTYIEFVKEVNQETKQSVLKSVVYCKNFLLYVREKRRCSANIFITKIGIDGGGGSLKICVNIQDKEYEDSNTSLENKHGKSNKTLRRPRKL